MRAIEIIKEKGVVLPLAIMRIILGLMLIWAFFDKLFGLGMETPHGQGMIDGGSPTHLFLLYNDGPFSGLFHWMSNFSGVTDILLMVGLALLGMTLVLGIASKFTTIFGSLFFIIMFIGTFPPSDNPLLDYHLVYLVAMIAIWSADAGSYLGVGKRWRESRIVGRFPILE